eukprot:PhM_4_TR16838/c0_g1_i1/m.100006
MMRRMTYMSGTKALAPAATRGGLHAVQARQYTGLFSIVWTTIGGIVCTSVGVSWAHSLYNLNKHGRFRMRLEADFDGPTVHYPTRIVGGVLFFLMWWFWWGPRRYTYFDFEKWQPRFGPF